ncbi:hypothetical protein [Microvirga sp. BSC39]|uniref:hypothetical protein n=1 Tax=Microvirga sp. BSC39 TaxID=1549810 RepID=UPI0004E9732A|nr:hypothetical protein [Microvirga sp. BSC39]KFG68709.1 hypothetical protein JH26_14675 [Microvirga sp. BSC39]
MARRVVMGRMPNGTYDVRISRRGFDALTADVNNERQISFSAQRVARAKVGAAGFASALGAWVSLGKTFPNSPPTLMAYKTGGRVLFNQYRYFEYNGGSNNGVFYGSDTCLVVQANRVKLIRANNWGSWSMSSGDRALFYTLEQG